MAVNSSYRAFVLEQLRRILPDVRARAMFGGVGIYAGSHFFAIIANDVLYFKVDDALRTDFEKMGMKPFQPYGDDRETMGYYEVPADILEDPERLRPWAEQSVAVARQRRHKRR